MKYILAALFLSAVVEAQPNLFKTAPVCDFSVDDLPIPSHAQDNMMASQGRVKNKSTMTVCDSSKPGKSKAFNIVSSTDFGPAGGQPNQSWSGRADDGSELTVVVDASGHSTASITDLPGKKITSVYRDAKGNSQSVTRSVDDYPDEADPDDVGVDLTVGLNDLNRRALRGGGEAELSGTDRRLVENPVQMDVLVLWTENAECRNSGLSRGCATTATTEENIRSRIALAFTETNDAYEASGVTARINLVHAAFTPYTESSTNAFGDALGQLRSSTDGIMDEAHTLREQYGADLVALIIDDPQYCGMAYLGPRTDLMFSVTAWNCATGYYSFGHEIGHNLGNNHDKGTTNSCSNSDYNYGWRDPNANFRSILAYSCRSGQCDNNAGGGCTRVKMFSNPNYLYNGQPIGDANHDNARRINDVAATVAGYYDSAEPTEPPVPEPTDAPVVSPTEPPVPAPTDAPVIAPTSTEAPVPAPTDAPVIAPTPVPPPEIKYMCHKWERSPSTICIDGSTSSCGEQGQPCGNGGKYCQVASCGGGNPPAPAPTSLPPPTSAPQPTASCGRSGAACTRNADCCNGCQLNGRWANTCK